MNKKIEKTRSEIRKTVTRLQEYQQYLKELQGKLQQQEDEEIINQIRSMKEEGEDVLDLVDAFKKLKEEKKGETDYETKLD